LFFGVLFSFLSFGRVSVASIGHVVHAGKHGLGIGPDTYGCHSDGAQESDGGVVKIPCRTLFRTQRGVPAAVAPASAVALASSATFVGAA
jgi:hypothetical protein